MNRLALRETIKNGVLGITYDRPAQEKTNTLILSFLSFFRFQIATDVNFKLSLKIKMTNPNKRARKLLPSK